MSRTALLPLTLLALALALSARRAPAQTLQLEQPVGLPLAVGVWGVPCQHEESAPPGFFHPLTVGAPVAGYGPFPGWGRRFEAVHLCLIPQPSVNAGLVLTWDRRIQDGVGGWSQRWAVLDPSTDPPAFLWNDELTIDGEGVAGGDLFCSGHAWMADGRLFVAGGTNEYKFATGGARLAFVFDPAPGPGEPFGRWLRLPSMARNRWYPTVTLLPDGRLMVSGGTHEATADNSYEVYDPRTGAWEVDAGTGLPWFPGPFDNGVPLLNNYRRMHVLSDGAVFMSGPQERAARVDHRIAPGVWTLMGLSALKRHDGASVLFPRRYGEEDEVRILGGSHDGHDIVHRTVESAFPLQDPAPWTQVAPMHRKRVHLNAVLLPDASVAVFGGNDVVPASDTGVPGAGADDDAPVKLLWKDAEITWGKGWRTLATGASPRDYHSSAVLLANGKVLTAGGDDRDWDYQLFSPPYLAAGNVRPTGLTLGTDTLGYRSAGDGPYTLAFDPLPPGITVARVVLMAPGSTTHHSDFGQRLVDLELVASGAAQLARGTPTGFDSVLFQPPDNHCTAPNPTHSCAPRGYYMLFAVTNRGVPSEALFVRLR